MGNWQLIGNLQEYISRNNPLDTLTVILELACFTLKVTLFLLVILQHFMSLLEVKIVVHTELKVLDSNHRHLKIISSILAKSVLYDIITDKHKLQKGNFHPFSYLPHGLLKRVLLIPSAINCQLVHRISFFVFLFYVSCRQCVRGKLFWARNK